MKQIIIISGKGGTGKTIITAAFAALAKNKVMADCDVDAADLHLLLKPRIIQRHVFKKGKTAKIDKRKCRQCGQCVIACRFQAIGSDFAVDPVSCEGCGFCSFVCPTQAIEMHENVCGEWFISETRFGLMVHAALNIAQENSGKLVSLVRQKAKEQAQAIDAEWVIIDGSPGIGCPVIASLSGVDFALVVIEPTLAGVHDAKRVIDVAQHFKIPVKIVINKYDINEDISNKIEHYAHQEHIELLGRVHFDEAVVKAMVEGRTIIEAADSIARRDIITIWQRLEKVLS